MTLEANPLARAKRTDRTDARRRYRAQLSAADGGADAGDELVVVDAAGDPIRRKGGASSAPSASAGPRPARPSFMGAVRGAYHAPNYREDLAVLPRLLVHWSVLLSAALAVVGTGALLAGGTSLVGTSGATSSSGATTIAYIGSMLVSLFVGPPPFGAALLIGFMVPRATYMVGLVFGAFAALCLTVLVLAQPVQPGATTSPAEYIAYAWLFGILGSAFFTAGIAWYKRFLDLLNPNRGQRQKASQKPVQGRGNAPRNRLSGSSR